MRKTFPVFLLWVSPNTGGAVAHVRQGDQRGEQNRVNAARKSGTKMKQMFFIALVKAAMAFALACALIAPARADTIETSTIQYLFNGTQLSWDTTCEDSSCLTKTFSAPVFGVELLLDVLNCSDTPNWPCNYYVKTNLGGISGTILAPFESPVTVLFSQLDKTTPAINWVSICSGPVDGECWDAVGNVRDFEILATPDPATLFLFGSALLWAFKRRCL